MFPADGKRLARRTAGNQVHAPVPCLEILVVNVAFNQRPVAYNIVPSSLIGPDGFASVVIIFEHCIVLEACLRCGKRQAAGPGE